MTEITSQVSGMRMLNANELKLRQENNKNVCSLEGIIGKVENSMKFPYFLREEQIL
jgi:hypothetical protein